MAKELNQPDNQAQVITKEYVQTVLADLFYSLTDATGDAVTAITVLEELRDGVKADPAFSRMIFTPDNIRKAIQLKEKAQTKGGLKPADFEQAYPELTKQIPFWGVLKTFI